MFASAIFLVYGMFFSVLCAANVDLVSYFPDIDVDYNANVTFAYGYYVTRDGTKTYDSFGVVNYALANRTIAEFVTNSKVSDKLYFRGEFSTTLLNEDSDPYLRAMTYGLHVASTDWGVISVGRLNGPTLANMQVISLESGLRPYFFEDAAFSPVRRSSDSKTLGNLKDFISFGPVGGTGNRQMLKYTYPTTHVEFSAAHALDSPGVNELGLKFIYDGSFYRWVNSLSYANSMPDECVNILGSSVGFSNSCTVFGDNYSHVDVSGKLSIGFVDWVYNYSTLRAKTSVSSIHQWFSGVDYTLLEWLPHGPLTVGIGGLYRKQGDFTYFLDGVTRQANDGTVLGYVLAFNKRFGRAGVKVYFERFDVKGKDASQASLAFNTKPLYAAGISLYYHFVTQLSQD